jgi:hemolysin D
MPELLEDPKDSETFVDTGESSAIVLATSSAITTIPAVMAISVDDWSDTAKEAIDALPQAWTRGLLYSILVFAGIVIPWAMLSKVDETGMGRGRLETKGATSRLEAATTGAVTAVNVREGQSVKRGQVLVELESDATRAEIQQAKTKLEGQMNRLSQLGIAKNQVAVGIATQQQQNKAQELEKLAQSEQAQQNLDDKLANEPLAEKLKLSQIEQARKTLEDSITNLPIKRSEKAAQLLQVQQKLAAAKTSLILVASKYQQSLVEVERYQKLWAQGGITEIKMVEIRNVAKDAERLKEQAIADVKLAETIIKEQQDNYNGVINQLQSNISQARSRVQEQYRDYQQIKEKQKWNIKQARSKVNEQKGNSRSLAEGSKLAILKSKEQLKDLQSQIVTLNTDIAQTQQQIRELERQLGQKTIRSPIDGIVLQLPSKQSKAFIQTGQLIAQIAPKNTSKILKVQMPSVGSGFLKPGMSVKVKFDAYPFQDYGVVTGKVRWVSPDSKVVDGVAGKIEAFELDVELDHDYIQSQDKKILLNLGQTASAEVITRQRRIIDFIIDPFKKLQKDGI